MSRLRSLWREKIVETVLLDDKRGPQGTIHLIGIRQRIGHIVLMADSQHEGQNSTGDVEVSEQHRSFDKAPNLVSDIGRENGGSGERAGSPG